MKELVLIDVLIEKIKSKADNIGLTAADMFIILTLEVLRGELTLGTLSEQTIMACREITSTTSHFYYYRDYPELYKDVQNAFNEIHKLDLRFFSADISTIGFELKDWQNYISIALVTLLDKLPKEYYFNKNS